MTCYTRARKRTMEAVKAVCKGVSKREADVESLAESEKLLVYKKNTIDGRNKKDEKDTKGEKDKKDTKDDKCSQPSTHYGCGQYNTSSGHYTERTSRSRVLVDTLSKM